MNIERRFAPIEIRSTESRRIGGYAMRWGSVASDILIAGHRGTEEFRPNAFLFDEKRSDILALMDHDRAKVLGRTSSGTLQLSQDDIGLKYDLDLPMTTHGNDAFELVKRGDAGGLSVGFSFPGQDAFELTTRDQKRHRIVKRAVLHEVSFISSHPAYPDAKVDFRFGNFEMTGEWRARLMAVARARAQLWV